MTNNTTTTPAGATVTQKVKLPSFHKYMEPEHHGDSLNNLIGTLSDHGLPSDTPPEEMFDWACDEDAMFEAGELAMHMQYWGQWLEAKVKGYEALRDLGSNHFFGTVDKRDTVNVKVDGEEVSGEWCRRDGVIYVFYGDAVETGPVHAHGTKSARNKADLSTAKFMLEILYERAAQGGAV